ncbi:diaminopimelate decarboxylase [Marinifilum caeruleilacunae]|uniref:Diaminopimelate decarboxylase n=1 Tax=Marinifilum caeruleilacunae TaxID=2499076 RepID=A0ABX1WVP3_9BACT|nr:diaminopimelate decarboxylase [Marinifilum caeruleilacunae]NOU59975.1 diaminopimelate decarboxylase [Marinifilum caeruleilacunae]
MFNKSRIEQFKHLPTPFYYYDMELLKETLDLIHTESSKYGYHVHYAVKANANPKIMKLVQSYGFGADCVSGNEVTRSLETGFSADKIVYAGVGKSDREILTALEAGIFCFNCESIPEIELINELAEQTNKTARIAIRINPNVDANTHHYITTGIEENKFGINRWEFDSVLETLEKSKNIKLEGLHFHIGSQITDTEVFKGLCIRVNEIQQWFNDRQIFVDHLNVGGGFGIDYDQPDVNPISDFVTYFGIFNQFLDLKPNQQLHFELGRSVVAQCGSLISKVLYIKNGAKTKFAILDAGMTELLRPALYQAYHKIENITSVETEEVYDVVGPICESSDSFGKAVSLPATKRNDLIALRSAGAYGETMASRYNLRDIAESIFSDELK